MPRMARFARESKGDTHTGSGGDADEHSLLPSHFTARSKRVGFRHEVDVVD